MTIKTMNPNKFLKNTFFKKYFDEVLNQFKITRGIEKIDPDTESKILAFCIDRYNQNGDPEILLTNLQDKDGVYYVSEKKLRVFFNLLHRPDSENRISITGNGSIFDTSTESQTEPLIEDLQQNRKAEKRIMLSYKKATPKYEFHDTNQKALKVLANSWYGANSQAVFVFATPWAGSAVTLTSQNLVMTAAMGLEAFLADNIPYRSIQGVYNFIESVCSQEKIFDTYDIIDEAHQGITVDEIFDHIESKCLFTLTTGQVKEIRSALSNVSEENLLRMRYKNNFLKFFDHSSVSRNLIMESFDPEFVDPMEPTEKNSDNLETLNALSADFIEYCYIEPKIGELFHTLRRKVILVVDTDSTFVYIDPEIDYAVRTFNLDRGEVYSKEGRIRTANVFTNIIAGFIKNIMLRLTSNMGVPVDKRRFINMKSEFFIMRLLLTDAKKSYAGSVLLQEGKVMETPDLDIKGLPIKKVNTPKPSRVYFQDLLKRDILEFEGRVDIFNILEKYTSYGEVVRGSLKSGKTEFLKPDKYGHISNYDRPFSQQSVVGMLLWNSIYPEDTINPSEAVYIAKIHKDFHRPWEIEYENENDKMLEMSGKIKSLFDSVTELNDRNFEYIALPKHFEEIPDWIVGILDYNAIITDNLQAPNSILKALNIFTVPVKERNYLSNVIVL